MNEQDTNKVTVALANSFLQTATVQQSLMILQEKALERAKEEVEGMEEDALQELLTNIRAQEIAQELRGAPDSEDSSEETAEDAEDTEETEETEEVVAEEST